MELLRRISASAARRLRFRGRQNARTPVSRSGGLTSLTRCLRVHESRNLSTGLRHAPPNEERARAICWPAIPLSAGGLTSHPEPIRRTKHISIVAGQAGVSCSVGLDLFEQLSTDTPGRGDTERPLLRECCEHPSFAPRGRRGVSRALRPRHCLRAVRHSDRK